MVKTVRLGDSLNYFFDTKKNEVVSRYEPDNKNLVLVVKMDDGSVLNIEQREIHQEYGGVLYFDYLSDRYMIDDGYQDALVRCGYLVYGNYDERSFPDSAKDEGLEMRTAVMREVGKAIYEFATFYPYDAKIILDSPTEYIMEIHNPVDKYKLTVRLSTVNSIVAKNQQRKINQLPYYPFNKKMDKYATVYLSIFGQRTAEDTESSEQIAQDMLNIYKGAENTITRLVDIINSKVIGSNPFHYVSNVIKKRIINWKGL